MTSSGQKAVFRLEGHSPRPEPEVCIYSVSYSCFFSYKFCLFIHTNQCWSWYRNLWWHHIAQEAQSSFLSFPVAVLKILWPKATYERKILLWLIVPEGQRPSWQGRRRGGKGRNHKHEKESKLEVRQGYNLLKPTANDTLTPARLPQPPKQCH